MKRFALRSVLLCPLLLLCACVSDQQASVDMLNRRLQTTLRPELSDNRVALQPLPDGAQVTLLDGLKLPDDVGAMDNRERDPRASIVEGLLAPQIMSVSVTDTGQAPELTRQKRVQSFIQYLQEFGLGPILQTAEVMPAMAPADAAPPGLSVSIRVVCPPRTRWPGYGQGQSDPSCR